MCDFAAYKEFPREPLVRLDYGTMGPKCSNGGGMDTVTSRGGGFWMGYHVDQVDVCCRACHPSRSFTGKGLPLPALI